jgi:hypothetical protein
MKQVHLDHMHELLEKDGQRQESSTDSAGVIVETWKYKGFSYVAIRTAEHTNTICNHDTGLILTVDRTPYQWPK